MARGKKGHQESTIKRICIAVYPDDDARLDRLRRVRGLTSQSQLVREIAKEAEGMGPVAAGSEHP